jgi:hypothetical protein
VLELADALLEALDLADEGVLAGIRGGGGWSFDRCNLRERG